MASAREVILAWVDAFNRRDAEAEWSGGGTWRGVLGEQAANGRAFTLRGSGFFHVVQGKIKFQRGYWDKATWFGQLGLPIS